MAFLLRDDNDDDVVFRELLDIVVDRLWEEAVVSDNVAFLASRKSTGLLRDSRIPRNCRRGGGEDRGGGRGCVVCAGFSNNLTRSRTVECCCPACILSAGVPCTCRGGGSGWGTVVGLLQLLVVVSVE